MESSMYWVLTSLRARKDKKTGELPQSLKMQEHQPWRDEGKWSVLSEGVVTCWGTLLTWRKGVTAQRRVRNTQTCSGQGKWEKSEGHKAPPKGTNRRSVTSLPNDATPSPVIVGHKATPPTVIPSHVLRWHALPHEVVHSSRCSADPLPTLLLLCFPGHCGNARSAPL
jgi:hypothetical protein